MTGPADSDAACEAYLGVLFSPLQGGLDAEDVELVLRDARRFARAAAAHCGTEMEVPRLAELEVGSLTVVFELVSTVGTLAGFLRLVERYWNLALRIALERARLRQAMNDLEQDALERKVERLDALSDADERKPRTACGRARVCSGASSARSAASFTRPANWSASENGNASDAAGASAAAGGLSSSARTWGRGRRACNSNGAK